MATLYSDKTDLQSIVYPVGTTPVTAGRLVATENGTTRAVVHASAGAARVVGVAEGPGAVGGGVAVGKNKPTVLTASGSVGAGERVVATGAGLAAAAGVAADSRFIVGYALEPATDTQQFGAYIY